MREQNKRKYIASFGSTRRDVKQVRDDRGDTF